MERYREDVYDMNLGIYSGVFKRLLDLALSLLGFAVLSPLFLIIAILIKKDMGSPIFFTQERVGRDERIFKLYKFRTMNNRVDSRGDLLSDSERSTALGRKLRSTSLDELPQLLNIIRGDMAIVGPRPLLPEYIPYYTEEESLRHKVRPGLTGLAQISGRNFIGWDKKLEKDVEYVKDMSFLRDMGIIFKTAKKVFKREGVALGAGDIEQKLSEVRKNDKSFKE